MLALQQLVLVCGVSESDRRVCVAMVWITDRWISYWFQPLMHFMAEICTNLVVNKTLLSLHCDINCAAFINKMIMCTCALSHVLLL